MKVIALLGSRNHGGRTAQAAGALLKGVREAGGEAEAVYLTERSLERCRQCDENGWGLCIQEGRCVSDDDFNSLAEDIRTADAVAFVTPVYWGDLSESTRALTDRLRRVCMHENGKRGIAGKPAIGICVAGGGGGGAPACTAHLVGTLGTCGFDVVDMVPVRRQNLDLKLGVLEATGRWLASSGGRE